LEHSEVHPPIQFEPQFDERTDVQDSCREGSTNEDNAKASKVDQSTLEAMPAFIIPMTQEKTLEGLPSQLDFEWTESVSPNPTPAVVDAVVAAPSVGNPEVMEVDAFVMVSQIAEEAVKDATQDQPQEEADPTSTNTKG
jgi:hypothetical protein